MTYLFVRHAIATEREEFAGDDLLRPLTDEGCKKARLAFRGLARFYPTPELIVTSEAVRARETAVILAAVFGSSVVWETDQLNPGADYGDFVAMAEKWSGEGDVAIVGHEPDLSDIIQELCGVSRLSLRKAGCAAVEMMDDGSGELTGFWSPRELRKIAKV